MTSKGANQHQQIFDQFAARVLRRLQIPAEEIETLKQFTRLKEVPRKSHVLNHGDKWDKFYFIHSGILRMFYIDLEGRDFNKAFFGEGQCIWPVAPMDRNNGVLFNVAVIPKTILLECEFTPLHEFLKQRGKWEEFALPFAERLVETKFQREHDFLLLPAAERYENLLKAYPAFIDRIPDYHLASFLGITNVSLSRLKKSQNF
ncbi:MAG: Crp/Fnr family transcriptional regulator [Anaerolineae bacterium]